MKPRATLILVWAVSGLAAVGGSMIGAAIGERALFAGAAIGGPVGSVLGVLLAARFGWLHAGQRLAASVGAVVGFVVATPIAVMNLHTPITPVLICSLAGVGALVGAGRAGAGGSAR
jgi:hypothetical protein